MWRAQIGGQIAFFNTIIHPKKEALECIYEVLGLLEKSKGPGKTFVFSLNIASVKITKVSSTVIFSRNRSILMTKNAKFYSDGIFLAFWGPGVSLEKQFSEIFLLYFFRTYF
jgi:hypothetical protein